MTAQDPVHDGLEKIVRRLDRDYWSSPGRTGDLASLIMLGEGGFAMAVCMIVDGTLVLGVVGKQATFRQAADTAFNRAADALGVDAEPFREDDANGPFSLFKSQESEHIGQLEDVRERYGGEREEPLSFDDIELQDVRAIFGDPQWIALTQARLQQGDSLLEVGAMSVRIEKVSAWWPADEMEGTDVNYSPLEG